MDAQTFHDLNVTIEKLGSAIRGAQYATGRHGMIPPDAIAGTIQDVRDALDTLEALSAAPSRPHLARLAR